MKSNNQCWFIFSMWHLNNVILIRWGLTKNSCSTEILISSVSCYSSVLCSPLMSDSWKAKNTHTEIRKRKANHCRASAKSFCSVHLILYSSYLYYFIEVWFLAVLQIMASLHCDIKGFLIDWVAFISSQHSCFSHIHTYAKYKSLEDPALIVHASFPQGKSKQRSHKMWEWEVMGSIQHPPAWHLKIAEGPTRPRQNKSE